MESLASIAALFFGFCLAGAAIGDVRRLTIPNRLALGLAAGAPAWHLGAETGALLHAYAGATLLLALGFAMFSAGWVGGGDVKFAAASAAWLAPHQQIAFLGATALAGAALAALLLAWPRAGGKIGAARAAPPPLGAAPALPYGVALAVGGLFAFPWSQV